MTVPYSYVDLTAYFGKYLMYSSICKHVLNTQALSTEFPFDELEELSRKLVDTIQKDRAMLLEAWHKKKNE